MLHRSLRRNIIIAATGTVLLLGSAGVAAADTINGTSGNNLLVGTAVADNIDGLAGNDVIDGRKGDDTIIGGLGNDWIQGGEGADTITDGPGQDIIDAGPDVSNDKIVLSNDGEKDTVGCGPGDDTVTGKSPTDKIYPDCEHVS